MKIENTLEAKDIVLVHTLLFVFLIFLCKLFIVFWLEPKSADNYTYLYFDQVYALFVFHIKINDFVSMSIYLWR